MSIMKDFVGGASVGEGLFVWNFGYPFARIEISDSCINIKVSFLWYRRSYNLPKGSIRKIRNVDTLWSRAVRFDHSQEGVPPVVIFGCLGGRSSLVEALTAAGYPVEAKLEG
jgi:hypothetical protein